MGSYLTRLRILSGFILLFALFLIGKLYFLQIVNRDTYINKADRQYLSSSGNLFDRGSIFFTNKDGTIVSAATLKAGVIIAINPQILKNSDVEKVYTELNSILPIDHDSFIAKATKPNDPYEEIAKHVDPDIGQKINDLKIPGLSVYKDRWRFYPGGAIAAQTIGMLGFKGDEYAGRYGLERFYEKTLERNDGAYVNFFAEIFSNLKSVTEDTSGTEGDVVTTIEPTVQSFLEEELASTSERWHPDQIGGIIINPMNGEIYSMAVRPTFDPNNPQLEKDVNVFSDPLVEDSYEMGSIIKPLTIAAGIDQGLITATSTYYDKGYIMVNGKKISNFDHKERGIVTMQEALSQSLNVGLAHVVTLLGNQRFTDYMYNFGVGEKTGIDLPNEGRNLTDNLKSPRDIEHVTASFGQGISLTPITTIRTLATVANGGTIIYPHLVKRINYKLGFSKDTPIQQGPRVIKQSTSEEVTRMMIYSVDNVLMQGKIKMPNYSIAAKTGTAQIAKKGGGGYSDTEFLHSFIGYFPAYNPKFFIFLYMVNPKGAQYSSETLTIPFSEIVKFIINYYELPPDR